MKTRLRIVNVLLLIGCGLVVWQMRASHLEHQTRIEQVFAAKPQEVPPQEVTIDPLPATPKAAEFSQIAMRMMFAQDRNPTVVEEKKPEPEPKKMPDLPVLHGVMNLGDGIIAMMSENDGGSQGSYKEGETIGEFKLLKITTNRITFEWDGKEISKSASELRGNPAPAASKAKAAAKPKPEAAKAAAAPPPPPAKPGSGKDVGGRERACQPGDNSPDGTVIDGYVKRTIYSPMGAVCMWEPVSKQ
jgi:type II secretory pathway component PulC